VLNSFKSGLVTLAFRDVQHIKWKLNSLSEIRVFAIFP